MLGGGACQAVTLDLGKSTGWRCIAVAEALKHNAAPQSFTLDAGGAKINDQMGIAVAEALEHNAALQSCWPGRRCSRAPLQS